MFLTTTKTSINTIGALAETKKKAVQVRDKLVAAGEMREGIDEKREQYRPVATRGAVMYFTIVDLSLVNVMYQTSLDQFQTLFTRYHKLCRLFGTSLTVSLAYRSVERATSYRVSPLSPAITSAAQAPMSFKRKGLPLTASDRHTYGWCCHERFCFCIQEVGKSPCYVLLYTRLRRPSMFVVIIAHWTRVAHGVGTPLQDCFRKSTALEPQRTPDSCWSPSP